MPLINLASIVDDFHCFFQNKDFRCAMNHGKTLEHENESDDHSVPSICSNVTLRRMVHQRMSTAIQSTPNCLRSAAIPTSKRATSSNSASTVMRGIAHKQRVVPSSAMAFLYEKQMKTSNVLCPSPSLFQEVDDTASKNFIPMILKTPQTGRNLNANLLANLSPNELWWGDSNNKETRRADYLKRDLLSCGRKTTQIPYEITFGKEFLSQFLNSNDVEMFMKEVDFAGEMTFQASQ